MTMDHVLARTRYATLETMIGPIYVAWRDKTIRFISRAEDGADFERQFRATLGEPVEAAAALPADLAQQIQADLEGRGAFSGSLDLSSLSPFQRRAVEQLRRIPRGEVRTYAQLAAEIGAPKAARAVGSAMARNPIPLLLPCHRVVRGDGVIGNYGMGGPNVKRRLLVLEGVDVANLGKR
jgi:methylated-DNA-[protein]-cysteine S-methyltransferase